MNAEGWIPREIILGNEAAARVPKEFIVQRNNNANPPALFLTLESLLNRDLLSETFLRFAFPRLRAWVNWLITSQTGKVKGTYRWQGRNASSEQELNPKTLTSGLDDYPRATHPTDDEIHVDLRCWIGFCAKVMGRIAQKIDDYAAKREFDSIAETLYDEELLDKFHWSEKNQMYCDHGLHSTNVKLIKVRDKATQEMRTIRKVIDEPKPRCISDFGYVSLFPFMFTVLKPSNPKLGRILDDIENPQKLWTNYGLRSLSKSSFYYMKYNTATDPPYWRGPIWINMNYLILKALNHYRNVAGLYQNRAESIYVSLRHNLISTIFTEYLKSGYIWEQYNDQTGKGQGSHPFTGWSALIVLIMSETYD